MIPQQMFNSQQHWPGQQSGVSYKLSPPLLQNEAALLHCY
jgi:hypothetical protein